MTETAGGWQLGKRIAPPRFVLFILLMIAGTLGFAIWPFHLTLGRALMAGFDLASAVFLVSLHPLLDDKTGEIRKRAAVNDANRVLLLAITGVVMVVILVAVASELTSKPEAMIIALVIATLALAWLFSNTIYALHYAHLFYAKGDDGKDAGGVEIPETPEPDYWDFIYFSFCLGMTFQTSDVDITSRGIRRVSIGHCLAAFVFNLGVVAFTINVLGGG